MEMGNHGGIWNRWKTMVEYEEITMVFFSTTGISPKKSMGKYFVKRGNVFVVGKVDS